MFAKELLERSDEQEHFAHLFEQSGCQCVLLVTRVDVNRADANDCGQRCVDGYFVLTFFSAAVDPFTGFDEMFAFVKLTGMGHRERTFEWTTIGCPRVDRRSSAAPF